MGTVRTCDQGLVEKVDQLRLLDVQRKNFLPFVLWLGAWFAWDRGPLTQTSKLVSRGGASLQRERQAPELIFSAYINGIKIK